MNTTLTAIALLIAGTVAVADDAVAPAIVPDPVARYPDNYRVLFEDERVRVLDFVLRRGDREELHRHPPNVAVFLGDLHIRFRLGDGTVVDRVAKAGDVAYSPTPVVHSPVNIGDTDAHGILVELKQPAAGSLPPAGPVP